MYSATWIKCTHPYLQLYILLQYIYVLYILLQLLTLLTVMYYIFFKDENLNVNTTFDSQYYNGVTFMSNK